jgi:hypothetical protein
MTELGPKTKNLMGMAQFGPLLNCFGTLSFFFLAHSVVFSS